MRFKLYIPIYDVIVWVVVSDDIYKERQKMKDLFGEPLPDDDYDALCCGTDNFFALFFLFKSLTLEVVSHEVFHLTHGILNFVGSECDPNNDEHAALLHSYLMKRISKKVKLLGY